MYFKEIKKFISYLKLLKGSMMIPRTNFFYKFVNKFWKLFEIVTESRFWWVIYNMC